MMHSTVPQPLILWIPSTSIFPSLGSKLVKSSYQKLIVKDHPVSSIISTASVSKCTCEDDPLAI